MRLPRFTPRLMVLVAVVATALYGLHLIRLHRYYRAVATHHARLERLLAISRLSRGLPDGSFVNWGFDEQRRRKKYHSRTASQYRHAARYPWLPVPPDPPRPDSG